MGKKQHAKVNVLMCTVAVLLCATLFSTHLVGGLYAKYTTTSTSTDTARVAKFSITQKLLDGGSEVLNETVEAEVMPGSNKSVTLQIENKSEVAVEYTIEVKNVTNNLSMLKFALESADPAKTPEVTEQESDVGVSKFTAHQNPGNHTDKYNLNIVWTPTANDLQYIGMVDYISISVTATQVD